jgi:hypothetical protein
MSIDFYTSLRTCSNQRSPCMPALKALKAPTVCFKMSVFRLEVLRAVREKTCSSC